MAELMELRNICFAYDGNIALNRVDLTVREGECVALMGPNGCGKSTLLNLVNGMIFPEEGTYLLEGVPVTKKAMEEQRFRKAFHQKLGYVFQNSDIQLFCASVYEEVAFGPAQMGLSDGEVRRRTEDAMELVGIGGLRDRVPYHLSGGEKKKTAIACILSMNPGVLILDEPLAGLDEDAREWLLRLLQTLQRAGKTLLFATHDRELAARLSARVVRMDKNHRVAGEE